MKTKNVLTFILLAISVFLLWKVFQTKKEVTDLKAKTTTLNQDLHDFPNQNINFTFGDLDPLNTFGKDGDFYLNQTSKIMYKKVNGSWF